MVFGPPDDETLGFSATVRVNELFSTEAILPDTDCGAAAGVCASWALSVVTAAWALPVTGANVQTTIARARPSKIDTPTLVSFFIGTKPPQFMGAGTFGFAKR